mgnify:CR=1 FL=1
MNPIAGPETGRTTIVCENEEHTLEYTHLRNYENHQIYTKLDCDVELDYDFLQTPRPRRDIRLHMFRSASTRVPYETKLRRMEQTSKLIVVYDSIMIDMGAYSHEDVINLARRGKLPRPVTVTGDTNRKGLMDLLDTLGYPRYVDDWKYAISWKKIVEAARSGRLRSTWITEKNSVSK